MVLLIKGRECFSLTPSGQAIKNQKRLALTLVFLLSAVVSSNSCPTLKVISVFLKALSVRMVTTSPFMLTMTLGLARLPSFRVASPTPTNCTPKKHCYILWGNKILTASHTFTKIIGLGMYLKTRRRYSN